MSMHPEVLKLTSDDWQEVFEPLRMLAECSMCPRRCNARRLDGRVGYCNLDGGLSVAAVTRHFGEEPPIGGPHGICNVFFSHCNLRCVFCQNHQISRNKTIPKTAITDYREVLSAILGLLDAGVEGVGFVSPSHQIPQMMALVRAIRKTGRQPVFVYNTNGYDLPGSLQIIEDYVDVYLPDLKYADPLLSRSFSGAPDYPEVARQALREMFRQKGAALLSTREGTAFFGMIIRHLVLPGMVDNSLRVIDDIAETCSVDVWVSLMAQYNPTPLVANHPALHRTLTLGEYEEVRNYLLRKGFRNGFFQEPDSPGHYNPDFDKSQPFSDSTC